ncbi:MAG: bifunctional pyr operon transcriptional regulator/uracil phosphoribosyltransferase PyrR, partial [Syntrophus sp. (in: bacteria)]|nr:bifunctional pyr operon transcriptional regulator/uracil phosphoribosyltransferase PyrR [Syntrophus sp. (in: bacteria)]
MSVKKVVMDADGIDRSLTRVAYELLEKNKGIEDLVLVGIQTGGVFLAERLKKKISRIEGVEIPMVVLDITLYRDDLRTSNKKPRLGKTDIPFSLDDKKVVLIDDVLFTGRTIRA